MKGATFHAHLLDFKNNLCTSLDETCSWHLICQTPMILFTKLRLMSYLLGLSSS